MLLVAAALVSVVTSGTAGETSAHRSTGARSVGARFPLTAVTAAMMMPHGPATAEKVLDLATSTDLPADCIPNPSGPPGSPYQLGLVGTVTGGVLNAGPASVANINVNFCGVVTVVNGTPPCGATGTVVSPLDGQVFGPLSVALTLVPGVALSIGFTANPGSITGGFGCGSSENGLNVTLDATVSGTTAPLFGVSCTIGPLTIPFSGAVTGPFNKIVGTLTSNDFTVPTVQPSPTCPGGTPAQIDNIAGLPIPPGGASASLPISASLYQPAT
jgi:hypothetical protein